MKISHRLVVLGICSALLFLSEASFASRRAGHEKRGKKAPAAAPAINQRALFAAMAAAAADLAAREALAVAVRRPVGGGGTAAAAVAPSAELKTLAVARYFTLPSNSDLLALLHRSDTEVGSPALSRVLMPIIAAYVGEQTRERDAYGLYESSEFPELGPAYVHRGLVWFVAPGSTPATSVSFDEAEAVCARNGGRIPTGLELKSFFEQTSITAPGRTFLEYRRWPFAKGRYYVSGTSTPRNSRVPENGPHIYDSASATDELECAAVDSKAQVLCVRPSRVIIANPAVSMTDARGAAASAVGPVRFASLTDLHGWWRVEEAGIEDLKPMKVPAGLRAWYKFQGTPGSPPACHFEFRFGERETPWPFHPEDEIGRCKNGIVNDPSFCRGQGTALSFRAATETAQREDGVLTVGAKILDEQPYYVNLGGRSSMDARKLSRKVLNSGYMSFQAIALLVGDPDTVVLLMRDRADERLPTLFCAALKNDQHDLAEAPTLLVLRRQKAAPSVYVSGR